MVTLSTWVTVYRNPFFAKKQSFRGNEALGQRNLPFRRRIRIPHEKLHMEPLLSCCNRPWVRRKLVRKQKIMKLT